MLESFIELARPIQFRGKYRLLSPFVAHTGRKQARVFGYVMELDLSKQVQRQIYIGNYERLETRQVRALLKPGMTVLDVGANAGYYTALSARLVQESGRVIAIEPYAPNFEVLSSMIRNNPLPQVRAHNFALSDKNGEARMYSGIEGTDAPVMVEHESAVATVPTRRLDQLLDEIKANQRGPLRVLAAPGVGNYVLPRILASFLKLFPNADLNFNIVSHLRLWPTLVEVSATWTKLMFATSAQSCSAAWAAACCEAENGAKRLLSASV